MRGSAAHFAIETQISLMGMDTEFRPSTGATHNSLTRDFWRTPCRFKFPFRPMRAVAFVFKVSNNKRVVFV